MCFRIFHYKISKMAENREKVMDFLLAKTEPLSFPEIHSFFPSTPVSDLHKELLELASQGKMSLFSSFSLRTLLRKWNSDFLQ